MAATSLVENLVVSRFAAAAKAPLLTDDMVNTLHWLVWFKWNLLFAATVVCTAVLVLTPRILRFGSNMLNYAAVAGSFAMSFNDRLVAPMILIMFAGMCGVCALLVMKPNVLYEMWKTEASVPPAADAYRTQQP